MTQRPESGVGGYARIPSPTAPSWGAAPKISSSDRSPDPYADCSLIAGSIETHSDRDDTVRFRHVLRPAERRVLYILVAIDVTVHLGFLAWLVAPEHWLVTTSSSPATSALALLCFCAVIIVEFNRTAQGLSIWVFSLAAKDPIPMAPPGGLRVAVLTTIVPTVEPVEMVVRTLAAMRQMRYPEGKVDVWILDEGDDPTVRSVATELGVHHFSRLGRPEFNDSSGRYRSRTKAGNHNAWLSCHGASYDVVAQLDPDHEPGPHFLERTLGYFRDPNVAFVVAPQVYGDALGSFPSHGAAAQGYLFHGVIQRGGNGLGAPLLIGTNHVYRAATWRQIGGYQDCIIEDHLTSMTVHATVNLATGQRWRGVYTPDVLAVGKAPATWGDLFIQQRRWAQGALEIALRHSRRLLPRLNPSQRLVYVLLQSFYPSVALSWVLGTLVTVALLLGAPTFGPAQSVCWAVLWATSVATTFVLFLWLRRMNLGRQERKESGIHGMVTTLCTAPIYVAAVLGALFRQPLSYHVTPKTSTLSRHSHESFPHHLQWLAVVSGGMLVSGVRIDGSTITWAWAGLTLLACAIPPADYVFHALRRQRAAAPSNTSTVDDP